MSAQIWVWWHERVNFFHPQEPNEDKSSRGSDKNALDTILSGPHQRITRYGLLLGPVVGKLGSDPKQIETAKKLKNLKKCADSLCRWMNGRVTLDHLHKGKIKKKTLQILYSYLILKLFYNWFKNWPALKSRIWRRFLSWRMNKSRICSILKRHLTYTGQLTWHPTFNIYFGLLTRSWSQQFRRRLWFPMIIFDLEWSMVTSRPTSFKACLKSLILT